MVWDLSLGPKPMDYSGLPELGRRTRVTAEPQRRFGPSDLSKYTMRGVAQRALDFKQSRSSSQTGGRSSQAFERARARSEHRQASKFNTQPLCEETQHAVEPGRGPRVGPPLPKAPKPNHRFVRERHLRLRPQSDAAEEDRDQEQTVVVVETAQPGEATTSTSSAAAAPGGTRSMA
eukprot:TRINITY_DN9665_c0_g3_i1.p1 TRINITY_DN9665_c0_g3~~TRINITY_DN9665_c0_g3_i1.p1  ORF type:complete len:176 (-),score=11.65 TRINITY_DN9665_c0_g3_i1:758-1285(-)